MWKVKGPALSLLWRGFSPWSRDLCMPRVGPKKKKKKLILNRDCLKTKKPKWNWWLRDISVFLSLVFFCCNRRTQTTTRQRKATHTGKLPVGKGAETLKGRLRGGRTQGPAVPCSSQDLGPVGRHVFPAAQQVPAAPTGPSSRRAFWWETEGHCLPPSRYLHPLHATFTPLHSFLGGGGPSKAVSTRAPEFMPTVSLRKTAHSCSRRGLQGPPTPASCTSDLGSSLIPRF